MSSIGFKTVVSTSQIYNMKIFSMIWTRVVVIQRNYTISEY